MTTRPFDRLRVLRLILTRDLPLKRGGLARSYGSACLSASCFRTSSMNGIDIMRWSRT